MATTKKTSPKGKKFKAKRSSPRRSRKTERTQKSVHNKPHDRRRVNETPRARPERVIDESRVDEVPQLRLLEAHDFDRIIAFCTSARGREAAQRLAAWFCTGLMKLAPADRHGTAYVQIDEPLKDDLNPFKGNIFFPSEAIVACVTGPRSFVNDICVGATRSIKRGIMAAGRFGYRLTTLPVWAVVLDDNLIVPDGGYFSGLEQGLREHGWKVWVIEPNMYSILWGAGAEELLATLPLAIAERTPKAGRQQPQERSEESPGGSAVDASSRWLLILLRKKAGPIQADWVVVFQAEEEAPDEEVDVRAWYYRLFGDEDPWTFVSEGLGAPSRIETDFTPDAFEGMPPFYRFEKAPMTKVGSVWALTTREGILQAKFAVDRMAQLGGQEVNDLDRILSKSKKIARDVPGVLRTTGTSLEQWVFGRSKSIQVPVA